jgi:hypothetical protein
VRLVTVAAAALLLIGCGADPLPGYRPATADERASVLRTVQEYYEIVDRALVSGEITPLYARHPKLAQGSVPSRGINSEGSTMQLPSVRNALIREAHVDIESYEPLRVYLKDDVAVAYERGLYTWSYAIGSPTQGELVVRFDLTRAGGVWSIEQTDEWVLGEGPPPPTPR